MEQIPLADMLVGLRRELLRAQQKAEKEKLKFKVEDIEVELKVGATKTADVEGSLAFWVVDLGAKGSVAAEQLQTVRLKLTPVPEGSGDTLVSDRRKK